MTRLMQSQHREIANLLVRFLIDVYRSHINPIIRIALISLGHIHYEQTLLR